MSWLDLSNVSNIFRQSYVNGFLDVSRTFIARGDASLNSNLFVAGKTTLHGDASLNGNLKVGQSIYENGNSLITKYATLASPTFTGTVSGISKSMVQLGNVDNTSDANKPISTATQTALDLKAPLASPALTGTPTAPTPSTGTNSTQLATTAFVRSEISNLIGSAPTALDTLQELAAAINSDASFASTVSSQIGLKAPTANPSFTGIVSIPTANISQNVIVTGDVSSNRLFVTTDLNAKTIYEDGASLSTKYASLVSPVFTGTIAGITKDMVGLSNVDNTSDTNKPISSATQTSLNLKAPLASPTFTGTATIPTASVTQKLSVVGDASFGGKMNVQGDVSMNGNLIVNGNILPAVGGVYNLGSPSQPFNSLYINTNTLYFSAGGNATAAISYNTTTGGLDVSSGNALSSSVLSYDGKVPIGKLTANAALDVSGNVIVTGDVSLNSRLNLGNNAILGGKLTVLGDVSLNSNVNVGGSLTAITQSTGDNSTKVATTEFVKNQAYATLASPSLTGTPLAPTATTGTNTQQLATTAFVRSEISNLIGSAPAALDTLQELATAINGDAAFASTVTTQIGLKAPINNPTFTGTVGGITKAMVGLGNVDNTSDANKPASSATQAALDLKAPLASPVFTGTVSGISKAMVGLSLVDNTADASKPVSTAQQTAIDTKANIASPTFTGTVGGISKAMVGLGNADNTSDANKPISSATQTALDLKAQLASPTFTGVVSGISKAMVGLSLVDNTPDTSKPVSTAQQAALDLKANIFSPAFTGTVTGITKDMVGLSNADNTSDANKPVSSAQQTALNLKSTIASPTFTGTVTMPTTNVSQKLAVTGDASFNSKVDIASDLTVTGNLIATYPANSVPTTALSGKVTNTQLTNSSVTIGSTSVSLGSTASTINGLTLGATTMTGDASLNSNLFVGLDTSMNGNVFIAKDLAVNGNLTVNQYKTKQTITTLDYQLQVVEDLSVNGRIFMTGDVSFNNNLFVGGVLRLDNTIKTNAGASTITLPTTTDTLVGRATTDTLTNKTISATTNTIRDLTSSNLAANAGITNAQLANKSITIAGSSTDLGGSISATTIANAIPSATITNSQLANSSVTIGSTSVALGATASTLNGLTLGATTMTGDASFNTKLFVGADASFGGKVFVSSDLSVNGNINVNGLLTAVTQTSTDNSTKVATTAFVKSLAYAPLASPELTGTPLAPTATTGTNTQQLATTAFVRSEISNLIGSAPAALDTLQELAAAINGDAAFASTVTTQIGLRAPISNPTFTGTATIPTANVSQYLVVSGDASLNGKVTVSSDLSVNGNLRANYPASSVPTSALSGTVSNTQLTNSAISIAGTSTALGGSISAATIAGAIPYATITNDQLVKNSVTIGSTNVVLGTTSSAISGLTLASTTILTGDASMNARLFVGQDASFGGKVFVASDVSINGNLRANYPESSIPPSAIIGGVSTGLFTNDISANSRLFLQGDASFGGKLFVNGDVSLNGNVNVVTQTTTDNSTKVATTAFVKSLAYAPLASPELTGTPLAPTPTTGTNTTQIATTAFVRSEITNLIGSAPAALDTLQELAAAINGDAAFASTVTTQIGLKAPLASPAFTGTATMPNATISQKLVVTGDASFNGLLVVGSDLSVNGMLRANYPAASIPTAALSGTVSNTQLANNSVSIAGSTVALGGSITAATIASALPAGAIANSQLTNNSISIAGTSTALGGSITAASIASALPTGAIANSQLTNKSITIAGVSTDLGGSITAGTIAGAIPAGTITNTQLTNNSISIAGTSTVLGGSITAASIASALPAGAIANSQLANKSITIAGVSTDLGGSITAASIAGAIPAGTITNSQLANNGVTIGSTVVALGSTTSTLSGLTLASTTTMTGDASMNARMFVGQDASFGGKVFVASDVSINGNLRANYPASSIPPSAIIGGVSTGLFTNDISANARLFLQGDASFGGKVFVSSDLSLNGNVFFGKDLTINGNLVVNQYQTKQTITTLNYQLQVAEDLSVNGRVFTTGDVSMNGNVFVAGDLSVNGLLRATYPESSIPPSAIIGGVSTGLFTNDISANSRLFLQGDASLNGKVFIAGDLSLNGNIVGYTKASTPSVTLDSWLLTNLVGAPPAVVFGTPTATSTYIYIPWTYPSQQNIGALQTYVPAISSLTITYDISNGSSVQANILSGNTSANCIASSSAILANPNVLNNSSTPITGVILAKSGSGPLGVAGFKTITFPSEAGTRNAYLFTDSNIAALTNSSIVYLHVYYSNYKTSVNDTSANTTGFAAAGTPSAPRNLSVSSTSSSQIVIAYYDPSFGDQTNQTTSTSVTAYQVTYTDISNVIRYYGISNLTVGPNAATGGVPTTNTPSIPASTPINSASTTLTSYIYPDSSYSIFVQAKNTGNTSFGPSGSIIYASTSNVSPTYTDITGISAASRSTTTCSRVRDNQSTNVVTDNTAWNFTFNAPIHETANRGNLAAAGTIAAISANVSGAKTVSGPVVNYTGFPSTTPGNVTANSMVMASSVLDSYTTNSGSDGFYLYTSNTLTLQSAIFTASSEQYTVSVSRTGLSNMGPKTSTFYYDTAPSAPTIGSFTLNRLNTVSGTTYKPVSGINVVYGSPTLDVSAGTIANVGKYFYNSSGILRYTASTGVSSVTTNNNDNNLTYMTTATSGNALVANIAFSRPALTTTLSNSYAKSIALTGNVVNISGTGASTTRSSSIAAIVDQPSITLVYSTLPSSINSINNATASYGYRIYSGKTSSSTTYIPSSPIYYTGSSTYSSLGYNHSWDITSSSNTGSIDATDELQIGNGYFQTYTNGHTTAYLDYTPYYFGASTNSANYSGVSQTGYRYATFAWRLTGVTGSGFNRIIFSLAGNTSSTIGANSVTTSSGNKIQLFYRVENPNLPTPSDATNLSTYWIDGNYTPSTVAGANYFTTSQTGLDVASGTTNTQFKVLLPYTINSSTVSVQPIIYCRIGLPMDVAYQFQYITAQMAFA